MKDFLNIFNSVTDFCRDARIPPIIKVIEMNFEVIKNKNEIFEISLHVFVICGVLVVNCVL